MEWSERMNAAIDYIEENLTGEIDFNEAAKRACCSTFHFQRIFFAVNDVTPAEYARRRRLTQAARELTSGTARVIDIAMKYGYDSPDAFTRAFRNLHNVTPTAAREPGVTLVAFPRVSFHIALIGGNDMDYRIIEKPAFDVVGKARKFTAVNGENFIKVPQFWNEFTPTEEFRILCNLNQGKPGAITGGGNIGVIAFPEDTQNWEEFTYLIAVEKLDKDIVRQFDVFHIPAATWAVFDCTLPTLRDVVKRISTEWFPSTGYERDVKPALEVYFTEDAGSSPYRCEIWEPIIKKK